MIALLSKFLLYLSRRRRISEQSMIPPRSTRYPGATQNSSLSLWGGKTLSSHSTVLGCIRTTKRKKKNGKEISFRRMGRIYIGGGERHQQSSPLTKTTNLKNS